MSSAAPTLPEKFVEDVKAALGAVAHQVGYQVPGAPSHSVLVWSLTASVGALHAQGLAPVSEKQRVASVPARPANAQHPNPHWVAVHPSQGSRGAARPGEHVCEALGESQPEEKNFMVGHLETIVQHLEEAPLAAESDLRHSPDHPGKHQRRRLPRRA